MKKIKIIILFTFICAVLITCKKEQLAPTVVAGQPVFSFSGTIGGANLNLQAGVNNYYMYSSYTQTSGVYNFIGNLQNTGTTNNSIQIIINDDTVAGTAPSNIDKSVTPATYYFNIPGGNPIWDSVTFKPVVYAGVPTSYTYMFGDGGSTTQLNTSSVTHLYKTLTTYTTSLSVVSSAGEPTIFNLINLKKQATTPLTIDSIHFQLDSTPPYSITLTGCISGGASPYAYVWSYGNNVTSTGTTASTTIITSYTYTAPAKTYTVALGVVDSHQDTAIYTYVLFDSASNKCRIDYYTSTPKAVPNPNALSNVTVNYTDGSGNVYTSNNTAQPYNSTFQITSVANYQNNMSNQTTKELKVQFNCILYNGTNSMPASGTAIIAVAYH